MNGDLVTINRKSVPKKQLLYFISTECHKHIWLTTLFPNLGSRTKPPRERKIFESFQNQAKLVFNQQDRFLVAAESIYSIFGSEIV